MPGSTNLTHVAAVDPTRAKLAIEASLARAYRSREPGQTIVVAAEELGCSPQTLRRLMSRLAISPPGDRRRRPKKRAKAGA